MCGQTISGRPVNERKNPLAKRGGKNYFCNVVSENVEIALKNVSSLSLDSKREFFVQCNQLECQYVDVNQLPCPLNLDLFSDEIKKREEKAIERRMLS